MCWGAIQCIGPMYLILIKETLNLEGYIKLLIDFFKSSVYDIENSIFEQDNCKVLKQNIFSKYLANKGIDSLERSQQSPDLSPIENVWSFLKNYLFNLRNNINSFEDLWYFSKKEFFSQQLRVLVNNFLEIT
ncbi:hypothetical protein ABPG72_020039 [Tetrahymena utriculariae]